MTLGKSKKVIHTNAYHFKALLKYQDRPTILFSSDGCEDLEITIIDGNLVLRSSTLED